MVRSTTLLDVDGKARFHRTKTTSCAEYLFAEQKDGSSCSSDYEMYFR